MHPRVIVVFIVLATLCATALVVIYAHFNLRYSVRANGCLQTVLVIPESNFSLPSIQCMTPKYICLDRWKKQEVPESYCLRTTTDEPRRKP